MFSGDKNIKTIEELVAEIKNYFELQKKYVGLECVSKLVILLSALILGMIMFLIGAVAFILIAFCMASLVETLREVLHWAMRRWRRFSLCWQLLCTSIAPGGLPHRL